MFDMDYHFLRQVGKCLDTKQQTQLKKPKSKVTKKSMKSRPVTKVFIQTLDELQASIFIKSLDNNRNMNQNRNPKITLTRRFTNSPNIILHSSSQGNITQLTQGNNNQNLQTQPQQQLSSNTLLHHQLQQHQHQQHHNPQTHQASHHSQPRPFSGFRNNLFDPMKFFHHRSIKAYPSLTRDFTMTLIEKIPSYGSDHIELQRYDLVKMKSSSPYTKQSMLKEFRSGNYRIANSDSNTLKEAPSNITNNQQQTLSRDQEIDDFLFNDQNNPNDQSTIVKNLLTEDYNANNKSFHTPLLQKRQIEENVGGPSRILSMNTNFKFQNSQAFKKNSMKSLKSNTKLIIQPRMIKEHKALLIIKKHELDRYENIFMEDFFNKKQVQKQLIRSMTHQSPDESNVKKIAINIDFICEDQFVNDRIMYIVWKNFNNKQYFVISEPEILDKLIESNLDDEKIYDNLLTFNLELKYQTHENCLEKKQEDQEFNEMLMTVDNIQEQSSNFLEFDLIQYVVNQCMIDEIREHDPNYFNELVFKIRRPCMPGVLLYINQEYFQKRYDHLISYLAKRKAFEFKEPLWENDYRICKSRDNYKHIIDEKVYNQTQEYLFQRSLIPQSEIIKIIFQPHYQMSVFYLLFDPDEDYELQLTIDRILQEMFNIDRKSKPILRRLQSQHPKILLRKKIVRERHKSLGYVNYQVIGPNIMINDSVKSDTSFRSSLTHKFSDNSVSQSDNENNKSNSLDVDFLPLLRKNAMRKSFARRKLINSKAEGDFFKHKIFKARIGSKSAASQTNQWSQHKGNVNNKTSMMHIENFEYTSDDDDDESDSSSSSLSDLTNMNIVMPKRISNISKNSEQISLFTPVKGQFLDVGKRDFTVQIQVGNLGSQKNVPQMRKSSRQKRLQKRASKLLRKMGSMDGILIDKFGYESLIRVDNSKKYIFEVFQSVEIKQDGSLIDTDQLVKDHSDDHLTTDSSLRDQGDDKFTDFDVKIQKQQLRKFFQQQKMRQKMIPRTLNSKATILPKMGSSHEHMGLGNQMTIASANTGNSKNGKSSLANLTHPYTTIGNYYKNLTKKKKVDRKDKDMAGEVVSAEEFIEDEENNFYLQMRNNIKIMELLNEAGANKDKQSAFIKSIRKVQKLKKNEFKEDLMRNQKKILQQNSVSDSDQKESKSLFTNSDDEERKQSESHHKVKNMLRKQTIKSNISKNNNNISQFHASNGSIHSNTVRLNLSRASILKKQSKISLRKSQLLKRKKMIIDPKAESLKKNLYMRDQAQLELQIIRCVVHQDMTNFKQMLHKFDESLDTYRDPVGNTLLSISTQLGNKIFVELLLQQGADPNIQNDLGNVPLHYSICNGFNKITDLLMEYGANEKIINIDGKAPWDKFN